MYTFKKSCGSKLVQLELLELYVEGKIIKKTCRLRLSQHKFVYLKFVGTMDNGYMIREKNHQTSKVWAFWACQPAAQTKSIYVEKNVAQTHWYMRVRRVKIKVFKKLLFDKVST